MTETGGLLHLQVYDNSIDEKFTLRNFLKRRINQLRSKTDNFVGIESLSITHNIFLTSTYKPFIAASSVYMRTDNGKSNVWNNRIQIPLNFTGQFISDMFLLVEIDAIGDKKTPVYTDTKYRYCHFPGIRLLKEVKLVLNGQMIDAYGPDDIIFDMNFKLPNYKKKSYYECIGHSTPIETTYSNIDFDMEQKTTVLWGYQTWKSYQPKMKMLIPLQFWFNKEVEKAFPVLKRSGNCALNDNIKTDYLELTIAPLNEIIQAGTYRLAETTPVMDISDLKNKPGNNFELYSNNIFVNEEICEFYLDYIDKYLINLHNRQTLTINTNETSINMKNLAEMGITEYIYFGIRPLDNTNFDDWYKFKFIKGTDWFPAPVLINTRDVEDDEVIKKNERGELFYLDIRKFYGKNEITPVTSFSWLFNKIKYIDDLPSNLFNLYISSLNNKITHQGTDNGLYMLNFGLKPLEPGSGHINFSRLNDIYLELKYNPEIPQGTRFQLVVSANILDFLCISQNSLKKLINTI